MRVGLLWILLAAGLAIILCVGVTRPWVGAHDWNGAAWSTAARNIRRAGWLQTRGAASLHHGPVPLPAESFYLHHPPMIVWLVTASFSLFGETEWAARLPAILASLLTLAFLGRLLSQIYCSHRALAACTAFVLTPAVLYYGKMPNHESLALSAMTAATLCIWNWSHTSRFLWAGLAALAVAFGCLSAWPVYLFAATLCAAISSTRLPMCRSTAIVVAIGATTALVALLGQMRAVRADAWTDLLAALIARSGVGTLPLSDWFIRVSQHCVKLLSPVGVALLIGGAWRLTAPRGSGLPRYFAQLVLLPFAVAGLGNLVLFREGSFTHEYYCYYLTGLAPLVAAAVLPAPEAQSLHGDMANNRFLIAILAGAMAIHAGSVYHGIVAQQSIFFPGRDEPVDFVRQFGNLIRQEFPDDAVVLVSAVDHGPQLGYYAHREVRTVRSGLFATESNDPFESTTGGVVYLGFPAERQYWESLRRRHAVAALSGRTLRTVVAAGCEFGLVIPRSD